MTIWFTSDTHFGHKNICRGESQWNDKSRCRDFDTVHEMNKYMTEQINRFVEVNDTLYHLGDFAFGGAKQVHEYINHINCKNITLVLGNHDFRYKKLYKDRLIDVRDVKQGWFTFIPSIALDKLDKVTVLNMQHYPFKDQAVGGFFISKPVGILLHGHTHAYNGVTHDGQIDISVEGNDYKPYSLEQIIDLAGTIK